MTDPRASRTLFDVKFSLAMSTKESLCLPFSSCMILYNVGSVSSSDLFRFTAHYGSLEERIVKNFKGKKRDALTSLAELSLLILCLLLLPYTAPRAAYFTRRLVIAGLRYSSRTKPGSTGLS